jgi:hypothetical protein
MGDSVRDDYLLISIEPPYRHPHGIGYRDMYKLIVATRFKGFSLYPLISWPAHVFVYRIVDENIEERTEFSPGQVELVTWAMLFRTFLDAEDHYNKTVPQIGRGS